MLLTCAGFRVFLFWHKIDFSLRGLFAMEYMDFGIKQLMLSRQVSNAISGKLL